MKSKNNLVWVDLEMSGLDPERDVILEIATIITDDELNVIAQGPSVVIHHDDTVLAGMSQQVREMHTKNGLLERVKLSTTTLAQAQAETLDFITHYCEQKSSPLCGNSVWVDRQFLQKYMPTVSDYLHYRIIDVSTVKELVHRWYPHHKKYEKQEAHRALDDIQESIRELKEYRSNYFMRS